MAVDAALTAYVAALVKRSMHMSKTVCSSSRLTNVVGVSEHGGEV